MRFEHVNSYPAPAARVFEMLSDEAFRERVCVALRAISHDVDVAQDGEVTRVTVEQSRATKGVPSVAQKFVGDRVTVVQRETWNGLERADFSMEIPGKPGQLKGRIELRESNGTCDQVFSGDLQVKIPLVGGKLEGFLSELLKKALTYEGRTGVTWLEERAG